MFTIRTALELIEKDPYFRFSKKSLKELRKRFSENRDVFQYLLDITDIMQKQLNEEKNQQGDK